MEKTLRDHIRSRLGLYVGHPARFEMEMANSAIGDVIDVDSLNVDTVSLNSTTDSVSVTFRGYIPLPADSFDCGRKLSQPRDTSFLGLRMINAMSRRLEVDHVIDGIKSTYRYAYGELSEPPSHSPSSSHSGLRILYEPDRDAVPNSQPPPIHVLCGRVQEYAIVTPGTRFSIDSGGQRRDYHYPSGLISYAEELEHQHYGFPHGVGTARRFSLAEGANNVELVLVSTVNRRFAPTTFLLSASRSPWRMISTGVQHRALRRSFRDAGIDVRNSAIYLMLRVGDAAFRFSFGDGLISPIAERLIRRVILEQVASASSSHKKLPEGNTATR